MLFKIIWIIVMIIILYINSIRKPVIYKSIKEMNNITLQYIFPIILLNSGIIQSILGRLSRNISLNYLATKHNISLKIKEGIEIIIDVYEPLNTKSYTLIQRVLLLFKLYINTQPSSSFVNNELTNIVLLHGLNSNSDARYILCTAKIFLRKGCRVFCLNDRGTKGLFKSTDFSHMGKTDDIHHITKYILKTYKGKIFYVGFSQGANNLTKYMGEYDHEKIIGGISICNPFNVLKCENYIKKQGIIGKLCCWGVTMSLKAHLNNVLFKTNNIIDDTLRFQINRSTFPSEIMKLLIKNKILVSYDNFNQFLKDACSENFINTISKPLLFINADDDPIIPLEAIPFSKIFLNENIALIITQGGHLGFKSFNLGFTLENIIQEFYNSLSKIQYKCKT